MKLLNLCFKMQFQLLFTLNKTFNALLFQCFIATVYLLIRFLKNLTKSI